MKKSLTLFLIFLFLVGGIWFFWPLFQLEEITIVPLKIASIVEREIYTPSPLRAPERVEDPEVILNQEEVIKWTNVQREEHGFSPLGENSKLNAMAQAKIDDMFRYQYFAHQSPLGKEIEDLAKDFDYEFLAIGENLAMGNFSSEQDLVKAWMESPGHRENILSKKYQEIGVAVEKGVFNGRSVWLAVQHFGLSLTACPQPSETVKLEVEQIEKELKEMKELLLKLEIELRRTRPKWGSYYEEKVNEYNDLVEKYNNLLLESRELINQYNIQVEEFNQCLAGLAN